MGWARSFAVFNASQVDNAPHRDETTEDLGELARIERAEAFFGAVPAEVRWGAGNPCYSVTSDVVIMPSFDAFCSAEHAYGTLAHELAHWTGSRLGRTFGKRFGDHAYAAEELAAELSAEFTCALLSIDTATRTDHAAYLGHRGARYCASAPRRCGPLRARPRPPATISPPTTTPPPRPADGRAPEPCPLVPRRRHEPSRAGGVHDLSRGGSAL
ncbi:MAG: zincin-like metallopeptidase domain-containing protein [Ilumatobacteraceae bacterium]